MLPPEDREAPRSWDDIVSKLDRKFGALLKKVKTMQAELEDAKRHARQLESKLWREVIGNG